MHAYMHVLTLIAICCNYPVAILIRTVFVFRPGNSQWPVATVLQTSVPPMPRRFKQQSNFPTLPVCWLRCTWNAQLYTLIALIMPNFARFIRRISDGCVYLKTWEESDFSPTSRTWVIIQAHCHVRNVVVHLANPYCRLGAKSYYFSTTAYISLSSADVNENKFNADA